MSSPVTVTAESTKVPITGGRSVEVAPKQPWPSAYRGSTYSLVTNDDFGADIVLKWEQLDLQIYADPPAGLHDAMQSAGKRNGLGSVRITARGEVITKVHADNYPHLDRAPVSDGWVPVYLGTLSGELDFGTVDVDPTPPKDGVRVWTGFPFNHGERWSVSYDDKLIWKWRDYRFESAFDHDELIDTYYEYRPTPGRLYVTEYGHVWANVPNDDVATGGEAEVQNAISDWRQTAEANGNSSTLRLVNRRLVATSQSDDPADGHLPIHLGHLQNFDGGVVPRPVVDDEDYYLEVGQYEDVWE
jgi:hypothetical protein